ncbi:hypothetical protein KJ359_002457 [Pestalotiopsis sp. 9143b]|nr:hypothetical protein KJ359_002457 [Pestalotiopsis sp. 9143b]
MGFNAAYHNARDEAEEAEVIADILQRGEDERQLREQQQELQDPGATHVDREGELANLVDMSGDVRMEDIFPMQNPAQIPNPDSVESSDDRVNSWIDSTPFLPFTQDERDQVDASFRESGFSNEAINQGFHQSAGNGIPEPLSREEFEDLIKGAF